MKKKAIAGIVLGLIAAIGVSGVIVYFKFLAPNPAPPSSPSTNTVTEEEKSYNVSVTRNIANAGSVTGSGTYLKNANVVVEAQSNKGYTFNGFYQGNNKVSSDASYTFSMPENDVSLEAKWSLTNYSITYILDGGTSVSNPTSYNIETPTFDLNKTSKEGYKFLGWDFNGEFISSINKGSTGDMVLTAKWNAESYHITLDSNGGTCPSNYIDVSYNSSYQLPVASKEGYSFKGWYLESQQINQNGTWQLVGDKTLLAKWEANTYVVSLDTNGGICSDSSLEVSFDSTYELPTPSFVGHTFLGWFKGENLFNISGTWIESENIELVAHWSTNTYMVSLNPNGGECSESSLEVTYGSSYELPTPSLIGYTFLGWYDGDNLFSACGTWEEVESKELVAHWSINTYTITLNANGGESSTSSIEVTYGSNYELPTPSYEDHIFGGWFDGDEKVTLSGTWTFLENKELVARWSSATFTIELDYNGGCEGVKTIEVTYGQAYTLPSTWRIGYDLDAWYDGDQLIPFEGVWTFEPTTSLKLGWTLRSYNPLLDPNGGECSVSQIFVTYGEEYSLPTPTREHYDFAGWYQNTTPIPLEGTWLYDSNFRLTAKWTPCQYKIYLDLQGGTSDTVELTVTYGEKYSIPYPKKPGYYLGNWLYNGERFYSTGTFTYGEDIYLVANWVQEIYKINFYAGYQATCDTSEMLIKYGEEYTLPVPKKIGYYFNGWDYNGTIIPQSGTWSYEIDTMYLYAKYTEYVYVNVKFDLNGGNLEYTSENYPINGDYELPTPYKKGHAFIGWFYGEEKLDQSGIWPFDEPITIQARYEIKTFELTVLSQDETKGTVEIVTGTGVYDEQITVVATPNPGYEFEGWYEIGFIDYFITKNLTYSFKMPNKDYALRAKFKSIE